MGIARNLNTFLRHLSQHSSACSLCQYSMDKKGAIHAALPRRVVGLTFCCRHSLHALFTPGCLFLSPLAASYPSSPLPGELWTSWTLFLFPFELTGLTGALLMLPALLWGRPNAGAGSALIWCLEWRSRSEIPIAISEVCSVDIENGSVFLRANSSVMVLSSIKQISSYGRMLVRATQVRSLASTHQGYVVEYLQCRGAY